MKYVQKHTSIPVPHVLDVQLDKDEILGWFVMEKMSGVQLDSAWNSMDKAAQARTISQLKSYFAELHAHHRKMLNTFHEIQREEHPVIKSVTAAVYDAVLNFREAYMEYIPNYPIAAYRIDEEMANSLSFKEFVDVCSGYVYVPTLSLNSFSLSRNALVTQTLTGWT